MRSTRAAEAVAELGSLGKELEDYEDLRTLREEKAAAQGEPTRSLDDILADIEKDPNQPVE